MGSLPLRLARSSEHLATGLRRWLCPLRWISYWAWAGATVARFNPNARGRGAELKHQLVRASIAAIEALWSVDRRARIVHIDPVINVVPRSSRPPSLRAAEAHRQAQFEAFDMLAGWSWPGLGGRPEYLDVIGVNYYPDNQWFAGGRTIKVGHPRYRPFRELLAEVFERYQRPIFVAETGGEGMIRVPWLRYVGEEVRAAVASGIPIEGICLYPIVDYPGWTNLRHCEVGLLGPLDELGHRVICLALADELRRQQALHPPARPAGRGPTAAGRTGPGPQSIDCPPITGTTAPDM
ncbi:MAG: uncharacterized protein K0S35_1881 [Geminicoccaceae bacterium]|nr:uncharacterized protein [Geminicoccaceae bacterium]